MERLNEILGRTAQRRQPLSEQRAHSGEPVQGPRTPQAQPPLARRPQHEQPARQGQKYAPQNGQVRGLGQGQQGPGSGQSHYYPRRTRNLHQGAGEPGTYENASYGAGGPISRAEYGEYEQQPETRQPGMDALSTYRQARSQPHYEQPRVQPLQSSPSNEYYPDDYASQLDADVLEDDYGMMNGDWEKGHETRAYEDENIEIFEEPPREQPRNYPSATYRRPTPETDPGMMRSTRNPRDLRDLRSHSTYRPQTQIPQARTQEVPHPHHQRITQPLDQQSVANISREREQARDPRLLRAAARQSAAQETPAPASALPALPATPPPYTPATNSRAVCPKCRGAGYLRSNVPFGHPNFGKPVACDCKEVERKERRRQQLRDLSNMDAFRNHNFRTFNVRIPGVQEAFDAALNFAESPEGWLVLLGPNGCGKTHLAAAIANQSLDKGAVVLFEAVPDLLDHLRAAFAPTATEVYDQLFSKMREAELLVLDDLGAQQSSPWANEKLFQLLNYRYNMCMPTVITANSRALQSVDERIRSRIGDISVVRSITMDRARDYRPTNPKRRQ
ncbi:MAG: hypothetical protein PVS3B1_38360 [Ktedonobacteraceae bacterium]